jgi:hypothetical protein
MNNLAPNRDFPLSDPEFVEWVENRTGLPIGWQSADSIERLHGIWLKET